MKPGDLMRLQRKDEPGYAAVYHFRAFLSDTIIPSERGKIMNEQTRIIKSLTREEQELLCFSEPVGYHTRLQQ